MPAVKARMTNVAGHFCSHIGAVSQEVPAAMLQMHQWHMRTRLKNGILYLQSKGIFFKALINLAPYITSEGH